MFLYSSRILAVLAFFALPVLIDAEVEMTPLLSAPNELWKKDVADSFGINNAVQLTDDGHIYVSGIKCEVTVLDVQGEILSNITGTPTKTCNSALAFSTDYSFFVQVGEIDMIPGDDRVRSEIIAYNITDPTNLTEIWPQPRKIFGYSSGTPIISADGLYTFFVTNQDNTKPRFIVINNEDGTSIGSELLTLDTQRNISYAPLGVGRNPNRGNFNGGNRNSNDMLIWGELYVKGTYGEDDQGVALLEGTTHYYQIPLDFVPTGVNRTEIVTGSGLSTLDKVTLDAPVIPAHAQGAFFSFNSGLLRCWPYDQYFGRGPVGGMKAALDKGFDDASPAPNSGILVHDDTMWVLPGPQGVPRVYGYEVFENRTSATESTLNEMWTFELTAVPRAKPQSAFNDTIIYVIAENGNITCLDTMTGEPKWSYETTDGVLADFAIIDDTYLAYGTTNGEVVLMEIGVEVTPVPTDFPSSPPSLSPSNLPSSGPSSSPSFMPSTAPSDVPSQSPTSTPSNYPTAPPTPIHFMTPPPTTRVPTKPPSTTPTMNPTSDSPSTTPSASPSLNPTKSTPPSGTPSDMPSGKPSDMPSGMPTAPTGTLTGGSQPPTGMPSGMPSGAPSDMPSGTPSDMPTGMRSASPSQAKPTSSSMRTVWSKAVISSIFTLVVAMIML